jgi:hypothetical protein
MDNTSPPTGDGDPQDARRTDQFWTPAPGSSGHGPHDPAGPPPRPGALKRHHTTERRHRLRWTVGLSLAVVLAAAGVIAGLSLASHSPASLSQASDSTAAHSGTSSAAGAAGQPQSQSASLNTMLNAADTSGTMAVATAPAATKAAPAKPAVKAAFAARIRACRRALAKLRAARKTGHPALIRAARKAVAVRCHGLLRRHHLFRFVLLRGVAGQFTIHTKKGLRTIAFERGVIKSVSGNAIVVRTVTGITEVWHLVGNTVVREHGKMTSRSALTRGEPVFVGGPVLHGARDARLIVIRPPAASSSAKPAPAASSGS